MCKINAPIRATSKLIALMVAVLILSISFVGCANNDKDSSETTTTTTTTTAQTEEPISSEPEPDSVVRIVAAGDNLIHSSIYNRAKRAGTNGEYNFDFPYEQVLDYISVADLAILNQETIVNDVFEPSSYPLFSSPTDLGDKMLSMGFNAFSIANNHVIDKGERGLIATL
ncbi:MAG: CapA family protein, partial [Clostridiales bacterium]|nr:CapA family protein [Clostridiales bacterium]